MVHEKSQVVRLLDVLALGPFLVYAGARQSDLPVPVRLGLGAAGLATIGYNLRNYLGNQPAPDELVGVDVEQLKVGTMHELEHTTDFDIAKRIALDHLNEDPLYYVKLRDCGL